MKKPLSLRERAIRWLAQREHSRTELSRKLARYAEDAEEIPPLLDELVQRKLLSDERYADARAHALARKFGVARIVSELKARGVSRPAIDQATREAQTTELARARDAWRKRFGTLAANATERAKQIRFLQGRGFSFEVIRHVIRAIDEDE